MTHLHENPWISTPPLRVTYRDTDQMGFVYYANYLIWLEIGRTEYLRQSGKPYKNWEDEGVFLPVRNCKIDYHLSAKYDDLIIVDSQITHLSKASVSIQYRVYRQNPEDAERILLAEASTQHVFMSKDGRLLRKGNEMFPEVYEMFRLKISYSDIGMTPTNDRF